MGSPKTSPNIPGIQEKTSVVVASAAESVKRAREKIGAVASVECSSDQLK